MSACLLVEIYGARLVSWQCACRGHRLAVCPWRWSRLHPLTFLLLLLTSFCLEISNDPSGVPDVSRFPDGQNDGDATSFNSSNPKVGREVDVAGH